MGPLVMCGQELERSHVIRQAGEHRSKRRRVRGAFQTLAPRPRFGELVQIAGSPDAWFEGRSPQCTLIVFIDDASSRLMALRFAPAETTRAYLEAVRLHVLPHGQPPAFYLDRHGVFRIAAKGAESGTAQRSLACL